MLDWFFPWAQIDWLLQAELLLWFGTILASFVLTYVRLKNIGKPEPDDEEQTK